MINDIRTIEARVVQKPKTGKKWKRAELREELNLAEPTLKRYISLLVAYCGAEFKYTAHNNRVFNEEQHNALKAVRDWYDEGYTTVNIIEFLELGGLPDAEENNAQRGTEPTGCSCN